MRTRLSIHISLLAFGLVLWQLQSVLSQKYYMNFAFNNNNPDANGDGGEESQNGQKRGVARNVNDLEGESGNADSGDRGSAEDSNDDGHENDANDNDNGNDNDDSGSSSDSNDDGNRPAKNDGDSGSGSGRGSGGGGGGGDDDDVYQHSGVPGVDDDNDDSDSHDQGNRPIEDDKVVNKAADDHSHHSSYEISIDDSFGGRYVRSIYESSESHGHSGSNAGSGSRRLRNAGRDSSGNYQGGSAYGDDDYEEYNEDQED